VTSVQYRVGWLLTVLLICIIGVQCSCCVASNCHLEARSEAAKCNSLAELRKVAKRKDGFADAVKDSLSPVKILLCSIFSRLQLKGRNMQNFISATGEELSDFWSVIMALDSTLIQDKKYVQGNTGEHKKVSAFMQHCCQASHYTFGILKCGKS